MTYFTPAKIALAVGVSALFAGCSMTPPQQQNHPTMLSPKTQQAAQNDIVHIQSNDWWTEFNDDKLNSIMTLALNNNLTLKQVENQIRLASQQVALAKAGGKPMVGIGASAGGVAANAGSFKPTDAETSGIATLIPSVTYDLDIWGKSDALKSAANSNVLSAKAQRAQAQLQITKAVAQTYFAIDTGVEIKSHLQNIDQTLDAQIALAQDAVKRGLATPETVRQLNVQKLTINSQISTAKTQIKLIKAQLALLLNTTVAKLPVIDGSDNPTLNDTDLASKITLNDIGLRPDVLSRKWQVQAQSENIKVASTSYYPDISLSALGIMQSLSSLKPSKLLLGTGTVALTLPLYDGGIRDAKYTSANIQYDQAVLAYNQTIKEAATDVASAVIKLKEAQKQTSLENQQLKFAEQQYLQDNERYQRGFGSLMKADSSKAKWLTDTIQSKQIKQSLLVAQADLLVSVAGQPQK